MGFSQNVIVPMGSERPNHYKIDVANPNRKIAVEIDGGSHNGANRKTADARKDSRLAALGWRVLRYGSTFDPLSLRNDVANLLARLSNGTIG